MASACHRGLSDSTELAWQEVGADQLGQLCKGGLQHWLKVDLKHCQVGAPQESKPRKVAQRGSLTPLKEPRPSQAVNAPSLSGRAPLFKSHSFIGTA